MSLNDTFAGRGILVSGAVMFAAGNSSLGISPTTTPVGLGYDGNILKVSESYAEQHS